MKILFWNCRVLGSKGNEELMKDLLRLVQPDIVLIQETKMQKEAFLQVSANFWKKGGRTVVSSRGASRGIGTLWGDQKFDIVDIKHCPHWILTTLLQKDFNAQVRLFNLYVLAGYAEKKIVGTLFGMKEVISWELSSLSEI